MGGKFPDWAGWLLGALGVLVLIVLGWFWLPSRDVAPEREVVPEATAPTEPAAPAETVQPEAAPEGMPEDTSAPEAEAAQPLIPRFDVVRIKPDGSAVVAGQAEPGAKVAVLVDGGAVFATEADGMANFVALFTLVPAPDARVMTLEATLADGTVLTSEQSVIIEPATMVALADTPSPEDMPAPASAPETVVAETAEPEAIAPVETPEMVAEAAPEPAAPETQAPEALAAETPAPAPAAPRVLLAGPEGVTVLQDENPAAQLSVDTITYDDTGEVALAGRGQGEDILQIYLDNAPVHTAEVGADGQWRTPLPDVDAGVYTLRVDSVDADGAVTSRVETPFKREEPAVLAAAGEEAVAAGRPLSAITVQPGHTLWAIAKGRYGEGVLYVKIYDANRAQIRDPDLIYPGQVFALPDEGAAEN